VWSAPTLGWGWNFLQLKVGRGTIKAFANKLNANRMRNSQLTDKQKSCIISSRLNG